jgi:hypothetical protein
MTAELLRAEAPWLPQFEGKRLRPAPTIAIPKDVRPVEVPLDPALAIARRFGELAERKVPAKGARKARPPVRKPGAARTRKKGRKQ